MQVQPILTTRISTGIASQAELHSSAVDDHQVFCAASFTLARLGWTILGALGSEEGHLGGERRWAGRGRRRTRAAPSRRAETAIQRGLKKRA